ncbi:hypothetical protein F8S13_07580 [Chloroflexia bacterium SDU3-3]|nr:hypothetical protein F8S13_07580 [Chloroflexia bacterium SDU3-3]
MAESDTILQLGIEAAREGNREEARNLFSLLTRQDPDNVQAWLWLAGVAEGPDERRAALEHVVALEPSNEMARKGLQALGVDPDSVSGRPAPTPVATPPPPAAADLSEEDLYAAELDSAFDDYDMVEKVGGTPRNEPTGYGDQGDDESASAGAFASSSSSSARERVESRRSARTRSLIDEDSGTMTRAPFQITPLARLLIGFAVVLLLGFLIFSLFFNKGNSGTAGVPTPVASATADASGLPSATSVTTDTTGIGGTGAISGTDMLTPTDTLEPTPVPAEPQPGSYADPATANPEQVAIGTTLEANGWGYTYPDATYAASLGSSVGGVNAQNGRFAVILAFIANKTGTEQVIPADLFVLKDAQGRVYPANTAASRAYVQPGINADKSLEDTLPADGESYSVALVFDVAPDATNLVLFTRANQGQGFLVLNSVP